MKTKNATPGKVFTIAPIAGTMVEPKWITIERATKIKKGVDTANALLEAMKDIPLQGNDVRHQLLCGISYEIESIRYGVPYETSLGVAIMFGTQIANGMLYGIEISDEHLVSILKGLKKLQKGKAAKGIVVL